MKQFLSLLSIVLIVMFVFAGCSDDDGGEKPRIGFQSGSSTVQEGSSVTVGFSPALPGGVTPLFSLGGTATEGTDYTYAVSSAGISFTAVDDGIYDPNETIIITLTGFSGNAELGTTVVHTITITEAPLVIEFLSVASTRTEGQQAIVAFNPSLPDGVTVSYSISGTATQGADYTYVQNQNGLVITTNTDEIYDPNETVIIELTGFSGNVVVGTQKIFTLTIIDEDESQDPRLEIKLTWDANGGSPGDVDMDLLVWFETSPGTYTSKGNLWSAEGGFPPGTPFEATSIPANETNGKWGLSYVYFSGTSNNLKVKVNFRSYKGNINGTSNRASFEATYTLANINNNYDVFFDSGDVLAQTYIKASGNYTELGPIFVAPSGSRQKAARFELDEAARRIIEQKMSRAGQ
jgi:hypothetical protein